MSKIVHRASILLAHTNVESTQDTAMVGGVAGTPLRELVNLKENILIPNMEINGAAHALTPTTTKNTRWLPSIVLVHGVPGPIPNPLRVTKRENTSLLVNVHMEEPAALLTLAIWSINNFPSIALARSASGHSQKKIMALKKGPSWFLRKLCLEATAAIMTMATPKAVKSLLTVRAPLVTGFYQLKDSVILCKPLVISIQPFTEAKNVNSTRVKLYMKLIL